jgi:hypothetical protein
LSIEFHEKGDGLEKLRESVEKAKDSLVTVGIHSEDNSRKQDGPNNAQLAAIHEFGAEIDHPGGTPYKVVGDGRAVFVEKGSEGIDGYTDPHKIKIPQRSFLRSAAKKYREDWIRLFEQLAKMELPDGDWEMVLGRVGQLMRSHVGKQLVELRKPPLSPTTVRLRDVESRNPLVDTKQLKNSIDYKVHL